MKAKANKKANVYEIITEKIIDSLEKGVIPWRKTWDSKTGAPVNFVSKKCYKGVNVFLLHITAAMFNFSSPYWMTFKQAKANKGSVRKGETGTRVVFWKITDKMEEDEETGEIKKKKNFILRYYTVFNLDQIDGIEAPVVEEKAPVNPIDVCAEVVDNMPQAPSIAYAGGSAFYAPGLDTINVPKIDDFESAPAFYSTLFHEMGHATGHESRLNRFKSNEAVAFGSESYSVEELVAEMTAAFLCGHTGIDNETLDNSASYIHGWSKKLKEQPRMIVQAAAKAQKAADFILDN